MCFFEFDWMLKVYIVEIYFTFNIIIKLLKFLIIAYKKKNFAKNYIKIQNFFTHS